MALNYFYNAQLQESPEASRPASGNHSEWLWLMLLVFLFLTHNDLNTCRHGENSINLIVILVILFFFTKATC